MFRVGILGTENSHAMAFAELLNGLNPAFSGQFDDFRVVAVGGMNREASRAVAEKCGVAAIADTPEEMLGRVDAVMITARDGKYHAPYARPLIEAGIPLFLDKPFTRDPGEALALARLARDRGVKLVGGSSLKLTDEVLRLRALAEKQGQGIAGGDVTAPVILVNDYGNFWFYASHLAECCLSIFGLHPQWVFANRTEKGVTAVVHYPGFDVTNHFVESVHHYAASVITPEGIAREKISLEDIYARECHCFADMLRRGVMSHSYEALVAPVFLMAAIEKSFETGEKAAVADFQV